MRVSGAALRGTLAFGWRRAGCSGSCAKPHGDSCGETSRALFEDSSVSSCNTAWLGGQSGRRL